LASFWSSFCSENQSNSLYNKVDPFPFLPFYPQLQISEKREMRHTSFFTRTSSNQTSTSPIFLQFLYCVLQLLRQNPESFEFNEKLLLVLAEHVTSCRFGNFLCDNEQERKKLRIAQRTHSLWTSLVSSSHFFVFCFCFLLFVFLFFVLFFVVFFVFCFLFFVFSFSHHPIFLSQTKCSFDTRIKFERNYSILSSSLLDNQ